MEKYFTFLAKRKDKDPDTFTKSMQRRHSFILGILWYLGIDLLGIDARV